MATQKQLDEIAQRRKEYAEQNPPTTERGKRRRDALNEKGLLATAAAQNNLHPDRAKHKEAKRLKRGK
jgi:hypothetical protein